MDWYVDAWAVRDGFAFTSCRDPGQIRNAERTVFVAVPDLVPVPIGRVSTALWATRANFQDRFLDLGGEEIRFLKLEHVIELVRRAYLAGGIGPGPVAGEGEGGPLPRENPRGGGEAHLQAGFDDLAQRAGWDYGLHPVADKDEREYRFRDLVRRPDVVDLLFDYLRVFGEATLIKWAEELTAPGSTGVGVGDFARWHSTLFQIGLWRPPHAYSDFVYAQDRVRDVIERVEALMPWLPGVTRYGPQRGVRTSDTPEQIVLNVPCPLLPHWDKRIRRLSDKLFLALSTWDYFDLNKDLPDFIPSLLAALAIVVHAEDERLDWYEDDARRDRLKSALDWLSRGMPQARLPADAENALSDFAWDELSRR